jgi:hypothetical protein
MPSVKVLRMIGAFLDFFPWTFFGPCVLVLLWFLASWLLVSFYPATNRYPTPLIVMISNEGSAFKKPRSLVI